MNSAEQLSGNERDAGVVEEICGYIAGKEPKNFFLFAGAGSGKTRTLVEVLRRLTGLIPHDPGGAFAQRLRSRGQSIRVITYTKNAVAVVNGRLGDNDLTSVSTIHSFCWDLIGGFDEDIRDALLALKPTESEAIRSIINFVYHPDRNTYGDGALQHAQVLSITAWLLKERPTLQKILADKHPVILIDESQDTMKGVLDALLQVASLRPSSVTLGFLGDHRQRIYPDGHSDLPAHVPEHWARPALQMNHRSQRRIVDLINRIWDAEIEGRTQPKTGVRQHSRTEKSGGAVRIFIGDAAIDSDEKTRKEALCARSMAQATKLEAWSQDTRRYHVLALEHKLAARRGNFYNVFDAMHLLDADAAAPQGSGENKGPSVVQVLLREMSLLAACIGPNGEVDEFAATNVLYNHGGLKDLPTDTESLRARLASIYESVTRFAKVCAQSDATVRDILEPVIAAKLFDIDPRLLQAFEDTASPPAQKRGESKDDKRRRGWHVLFASRWAELGRYRDYLSGKAELATHQVVKGSEFEHVMVVMDDNDAGGSMFSYDKLFGSAALSPTDRDNLRNNKETTIDRTLRLLYVTCSRARESLILVLWAKDPQAALSHIKASSWFDEHEIAHVP